MKLKTPGFYVITNKYDREQFVYLSSNTRHGPLRYSYAAISMNTESHDSSHDFLVYIWSDEIKHVRWMTKTEAWLHSQTLYTFGRPSWAHPKGRKPLSIDDVSGMSSALC
jgi:hypothetical protein